LEQWPDQGIPDNPRAWLITTARYKALDRIRQRTRHQSWVQKQGAHSVESAHWDSEPWDEATVLDDHLRLIFTCCHPALAQEAQIALTLREVSGLSTEEVASAFLCPVPTMAQRIVRAKAKIREAGIPFQIPTVEDLAGRLDAVLTVIYLIFNEGYSASMGSSVLRVDLSTEGIRLARTLLELQPHPEVMGLLALMLLHESRREARTSPEGEIVLLEEQDRTRWNPDYIREGQDLIRRSLASRRFGAYTIQAAISAVHAEAADAASTDWAQIVSLYDVLLRFQPGPVIELNRAVALAMRDGPDAGLHIIDALFDAGELVQYHLAHATRGELLRRLGRWAEARVSLTRALELARQEPERRLLQRKLASLPDTSA
jgi:RNA polymerase sigma-70 factor (ECF subfamily)